MLHIKCPGYTGSVKYTGASRWRVCYQPGLPCQVIFRFFLLEKNILISEKLGVGKGVSFAVCFLKIKKGYILISEIFQLLPTQGQPGPGEVR